MTVQTVCMLSILILMLLIDVVDCCGAYIAYCVGFFPSVFFFSNLVYPLFLTLSFPFPPPLPLLLSILKIVPKLQHNNAYENCICISGLFNCPHFCDGIASCL